MNYKNENYVTAIYLYYCVYILFHVYIIYVYIKENEINVVELKR